MPGTDSLLRLRQALLDTLVMREPSPPASAAALEEEYRAVRGPAYGIPGRVLLLEDPRSGLPFLKAVLADENGLVALEAAAALALLGDRSGLHELQSPRGASNSNIESFISRAGLLVLGERIPEERAGRSVFRGLEELIDACLADELKKRLDADDQHEQGVYEEAKAEFERTKHNRPSDLIARPRSRTKTTK